MQTNQSKTKHLTISFINSHSRVNIAPAVNHPRAGYQVTRGHPIAWSLLKLFKLANPDLPCLSPSFP